MANEEDSNLQLRYLELPQEARRDLEVLSQVLFSSPESAD